MLTYRRQSSGRIAPGSGGHIGFSRNEDNRADLDDDGAMRPLHALAGLVVIIGLAVPAQADPSSTDPGADANFLDSLNKAGMSYRDGPGAVAAGRMACDLMDQGMPEFDVIQRVTALNPGLGLPGATRFTAIASSVYCPQYLDKSSAKTTSPPPFPGLPGR